MYVIKIKASYQKIETITMINLYFRIQYMLRKFENNLGNVKSYLFELLGKYFII